MPWPTCMDRVGWLASRFLSGTALETPWHHAATLLATTPGAPRPCHWPLGSTPARCPCPPPQLAHRQGRHSWEADNAAQYLHVNWCLTPLPDLWLDNRARMFPLSSRPRPPDTSSCRLPVCRDHGASRVSYQWDCPGLRPSPCNCSAGVQVPCRTVQYSKGDGKMSRTSIQPGQPSMFQNEMRPGTQSEPATSQRKASPQRGSTGGGEGGGPHEDQPVSLTPPHCTGAGPGRQSQQAIPVAFFS